LCSSSFGIVISEKKNNVIEKKNSVINEKGRIMTITRKASLMLTAVLVLGFGAGVFFMTSLGAGSGGHPSEQPPEQAEPAASQITVPAQGKELLHYFSTAFEAAAARVNPSVVPIQSEQVTRTQDPFSQFGGDDFFRRFFGAPRGEQKQTIRALGSGVIVSADGYILTNNHVVDGAEKLTVTLQDKKKYTAKVVGRDPQTDLAVVKIDVKGLPVASLGNSDTVRVGQWVIAVGNPFQLMHTVTAGIISAKGRSDTHLADYEDFIQTDASINPGNSGGALADLDGNVIGINTAIVSPNGTGNIGIGFAVPINMAKSVMRSLIDKGKVSRGFLGLLPQDIDENLGKALNLKTTDGALVGDVTPDAPAAKAGIKQGDIITGFNGSKVTGSTQLRNLVAEAGPGSEAKVGILRDGKPMEFTVKLGEKPADASGKGGNGEGEGEEQSSQKLGVSVQALTAEIADQLGYKGQHGVVVAGVTPGTPAEDAGLQRGDLIKEVNRKGVASPSEFEQAVRRAGKNASIALLVQRGKNSFFVAIQS
jgi:serine protease Do